METCVELKREVEMPVDLAETFAKITSWDLSKVKAYMVNRGLYESPGIDLLEREYKRFILLSISNPEKSVPISTAVDNMWHTHILFTKNYTDFCNYVKGKYIHHNPTVDENERAQLKDVYEVNTLKLYKSIFGDYDEVFWAVNGQVCKECCNDE